MKKRLSFSTALLSVLLVSACSSSTKSTKGAEDVSSSSKGGCSEVDPFCGKEASDSKESSGGGDSPSDSGSSSSSGDSSSASASSGADGASSSGAPATTTGSSGGGGFRRVIAVDKPKEAAASPDDKKKDGDKAAKAPAKAPAKGKQPPAKEGVSQYKVILHPKGMAWGLGLEQLAKLYERLFDAAYNPVYKKTPVGPQLDSLDAEVKEKKALLRRNQVEFGTLPTGVDNTALKGEYSYLNNESMTKIDLENGVVRNFFFFGNRLWKVYDEHKLGNGPLGANWESAVAYLTEQLGTKPKLVPANDGQDRAYDEAEWRDGTNLVRLINREATNTVAVVFVDESIQNKLPSLRKNKPKDPGAVESSVRAATAAPPPPPEPKKDKPKKK